LRFPLYTRFPPITPYAVPLGTQTRQRADVIVGDLTAATGPFADSAAIVFGRAGVVAIEEAGKAIKVSHVGITGETTTFHEPGDEIIP